MLLEPAALVEVIERVRADVGVAEAHCQRPMNSLLDTLDSGLLLDSEGRVVLAKRGCTTAAPRPWRWAGLWPKPLGAQSVVSRLLRSVADCLVRGEAARLSRAFLPTPLPIEALAGGEAPEAADAVGTGAPQVPPGLLRRSTCCPWTSRRAARATACRKCES